MSARILGEHNNTIRSEVASEVDRRRGSLRQYLTDNLSGPVTLVVPKGATENAENIRSVVLSDGININQQIVDQGYGQYREDLGGAEAQAMFGKTGQAFGSLAEALAFQGDSSRLNPMRYLGSAPHTKLWQVRTPLAQYINNEVTGTRMGRWERPVPGPSVLPDNKILARARALPRSPGGLVCLVAVLSRCRAVALPGLPAQPPR